MGFVGLSVNTVTVIHDRDACVINDVCVGKQNRIQYTGRFCVL